jgi:phosphatidylserine/phosphatidylglycerophosphate/cardiolipin synthase-like enzyme
VKLIILPDDGLKPLVRAIEKAKERLEITIFRLDRREIERALVEAAARGVFVHALIAFTNRGGEQGLRKLEKRLLANGITVARTSRDLVRYHAKMMIVDRKELYILAFNFTSPDIDHSRSFGLATRNRKLVAEAVRLFEADSKRQPYTAENRKLLVSPVNARQALTRFLAAANRELLIYDPKISDRAMLGLLEQRRHAGVRIRILGQASGNQWKARALKSWRLHTRAIVRDRAEAFLGSQSLRQMELDARREIGVLFQDGAAVKRLVRTFDKDWAASAKGAHEVEKGRAKAASKRPGEIETRQVAKSVSAALRERRRVKPVAKKLLKSISAQAQVELKGKKIRRTVTDIVEKVVEKTAQEAAAEAANRLPLDEAELR